MATDSFKYHHVVITGASSGIGRALALKYARTSAHLSLTGRNKQRLAEIAQECRNMGPEVTEKVIDVRARDDMHEWLLKMDRTKPIDLLIANAGVSGGTGAMDVCETTAQVQEIFDINVTGVFNSIQPLLDPMCARQKGQIVIMSSLASFRGFPGAPAYCASKAAVRVYGEGLRGAVSKYNVGVSVICPGFVESSMTAVNDFPMPFLMPASRAAHIIYNAIGRNRGRVAFPWPMYCLVWAIGALPNWLSHR
ncbi:MAG: SDR family NAD(P)-dependent oxidoreductase, partial [Pseudomonadota bacterium]